MRYLLTLKYLGTNFCGWQVQPNGPTVQAAVCSAALQIFGKKTDIVGCSRTDSGVHALGFCCHFDAQTEIPPEKIIDAFNNNLPEGISVVSCITVSDDFHARYSAKGKTYVYRIYNSRVPEPFEDGRAYWIKYALDLEKMQIAAKNFCGTYDFTAFCSAGSSVEDKVRTIYDCSVIKSGDIVEVTVSGNGFLYNMVRIIVGTLIDVGTGKIKPDDIKKIIESKDRSRAGSTKPAEGLYLKEVFY